MHFSLLHDSVRRRACPAFRAALFAGLAALSVPVSAQPTGRDIVPVKIESIDRGTGRVSVNANELPPDATGGQLMVATANTPIGLCSFESAAESSIRFRLPAHATLPADPAAASAWWIGTQAVGLLREMWPSDTEFYAEIDSVGPGGRTAWLRRGGNDGTRVGDSWWLKVGGQPAARFDVRLVEPELCFCRVLPLVSDAPVRRGERVALWPSPAQRRDGRAISAVTFVERSDDHPRMWVAWPPGADLPDEPHLEFFRAGRYLAHAIADRRDDRFWYARPIRGASVADVQVGDVVHARTRTDVERRRFIARVFEIRPEGALMTAGEEDGISPGETCAVFRDGQPLVTAIIGRVQREYALVRPDPESGAIELRVLDEIHFGDAAIPPRQIVGVVEQVVAETLIRVRSRGGAALPLHTPLAVRVGERALAVAVLVAGSGDQAIGFLPTAGLGGAVSPGAELEASP